MNQSHLILLPAVLALAACSNEAPSGAGGAESEIARLERQAADLPPPASVPAGTRAALPMPASAAPVTQLVSPSFETAAETSTIALDALSRATESEVAFDAALATAREQVMTARAAVKTGHDRNAAIVLTALLAKQKELGYLNLLISRNSTIKPDPGLESEVAACSNELRSWLQGSAADVERLQRGECLTAARSAIALLSQ
jgi:hypothetical protein